jgi:hypothetical protein
MTGAHELRLSAVLRSDVSRIKPVPHETARECA